MDTSDRRTSCQGSPTSGPGPEGLIIDTERLPHGRINPRTSIPFFVVHLVPLLAVFTGVPARRGLLFASPTGSGCSSSPPATTATSRTGRSGPAGCSSSSSPTAGEPPCRRAPCGGRATTGSTTATPTPPRTPTPPARGSGGATSVGSSPTRRRCPTNSMKDFEKYPEIRFLTRHDWIPPWSLAVVCFLVGGWSGLLVGFLLSTVRPVALDVPHQLAGPRVRVPPVRDRGHESEQPAARAADDG
jgi:stearoyl-CoA desaturase (Delta-9 desaturase)